MKNHSPLEPFINLFQHCKSLKLIKKYFLDLRNMFSNQENIRIFFSKQEK